LNQAIPKDDIWNIVHSECRGPAAAASLPWSGLDALARVLDGLLNDVTMKSVLAAKWHPTALSKLV
jgi:hypothetical protein